MIKQCKALFEMFERGYRPEMHGEWIDSYNRTVHRDGVACCISTRIDARNQDFVVVRYE